MGENLETRGKLMCQEKKKPLMGRGGQDKESK